MHRTIRVLLLLPCLLAPVVAAQEAATPTTPSERAKKRIGFYFGLTLTKLSQQGQANGIGFVVDPPTQPGFPFPVSGDQVDADFNSRLNLEFMVGFRFGMPTKAVLDQLGKQKAASAAKTLDMPAPSERMEQSISMQG